MSFLRSEKKYSTLLPYYMWQHALGFLNEIEFDTAARVNKSFNAITHYLRSPAVKTRELIALLERESYLSPHEVVELNSKISAKEQQLDMMYKDLLQKFSAKLGADVKNKMDKLKLTNFMDAALKDHYINEEEYKKLSENKQSLTDLSILLLKKFQTTSELKLYEDYREKWYFKSIRNLTLDANTIKSICFFCQGENKQTIAQLLLYSLQNHFPEELALYLLKFKADVQTFGDSCYFAVGGYALHAAAKNNYTEVVKTILKFKLMSASQPSYDTKGGTVLSSAIKNNNKNLVKYLLAECKVDPNIEDKPVGGEASSSHLCNAVFHGSFEITKLLLDHGANPNQVPNGWGCGKSVLGAAVIGIEYECQHSKNNDLLRQELNKRLLLIYLLLFKGANPKNVKVENDVPLKDWLDEAAVKHPIFKTVISIINNHEKICESKIVSDINSY